MPPKSKRGSYAFAAIIAAIAAVMAALVFLPGPNSGSGNAGVSSGAQLSLLSVDYERQNFTGIAGTGSSELLSISSDGSAKYSALDNNGAVQLSRNFKLSDEEEAHLHSLIAETGFLNMPDASYPQSANATQFTRYSIAVSAVQGQAGASGSAPVTKTVTWVNLEASRTTVPPIIRNIGMDLDEIISAHR